MEKQKWNDEQIKECKSTYGSAWRDDDAVLRQYSEDFGRIQRSTASAIFTPESKSQLTSFIDYAHKNHLTLTARCFGLSQSGQSLAIDGSVLIDLSQLRYEKLFPSARDSIRVGAANRWSEIVRATIAEKTLPQVIPYNLDLSVGGILSAGGLGAASFNQGVIASHVKSLEVVTASDGPVLCDREQNADLFFAALAGQGQFGVITDVELSLRECSQRVRRYFLLFEQAEEWLACQRRLHNCCHHVEAFTSPLVQGSVRTESGVRPLLTWFYCLQIAVEYESEAPNLQDLGLDLSTVKQIQKDDSTLNEYALRHVPRFEAMRANGQWEQAHPWYECFLPIEVLERELSAMLEIAGMSFGGIYHIFPVNTTNSPPYFMLPQGDVFAFTMLAPGVSASMHEACLSVIARLDELLLEQGAKRYLSGVLCQVDWERHYAHQHPSRLAIKKRYDPHGIFCSKLYPSA